MEGANKVYGTNILIAERTYKLASSKIEVREIDLLQVKGKSQPTRVFELLHNDSDRHKIDNALASYRNQEWDKAHTEFQRIVSDDNSDSVAREFQNRIEIFKKNPPSEDWQGVWELTTK